MTLRLSWKRAALAAETLAALCVMPSEAAAAARDQVVLTLTIEHGASVTVFAWREGAELFIEHDTFVALGLAPPVGESAALHAVPGLSYEIDEAQSEVRIRCGAACYPAQVLGGAPKGDSSAPSLLATIVNYDINAGAIDGKIRLVGLFDGAISKGGVYAEASVLGDSQFGARRLDTAITLDNPGSRTRLRVGDAISQAGSWGAPVRYGGLKFGTDFSLDPSFIPYPTPNIEGAAALPSAVNVFVDGVLRQSREAAAGPFSIADPPLVTGAGTARVVVTDLLGRQQQSVQTCRF
jgi:outer membrane usher protein